MRLRLGDAPSDREIARRWGMEWKSFAGLKHGKRQVPRIQELERLAAVLEVEPVFVFQVAGGVPADEIAALLVRETQLRAVLDRLTDAVFTLDPAGHIRDMNERFCAIVGRPRAQLFGASLWSLLPPEDARRARTALAAVAAAGEARGIELVLQRPDDGQLRHLELSGSRIQDASGDLLGTQIVAHDVTERRRLEVELESERRALQLIFDNVPAACLVVERDGTISRANALVERVCPATAAELIGNNAKVVFGEASGARCPVARAFKTGRTEYQKSVLHNRAGERVYVHRTAGPILGRGTVEKVIEILVDVTPQIRRGDVRIMKLWDADTQPGSTAGNRDERRRAPRLDAEVEIELRHEGRRIMGRVENLAGEGMFVQVRDPLPVGAEVELRWRLPADDLTLHARALIVWRRASSSAAAGVGVCLLEPPRVHT